MSISGTIRITAAGTRVQAANKGNARSIIFKARHGNMGDVYLGGSDISSTDGMTLVPGEAIHMQVNEPISISQLWADADNDGDQVDFLALD